MGDWQISLQASTSVQMDHGLDGLDACCIVLHIYKITLQASTSMQIDHVLDGPDACVFALQNIWSPTPGSNPL